MPTPFVPGVPPTLPAKPLTPPVPPTPVAPKNVKKGIEPIIYAPGDPRAKK